MILKVTYFLLSISSSTFWIAFELVYLLSLIQKINTLLNYNMYLVGILIFRNINKILNYLKFIYKGKINA